MTVIKLNGLNLTEEVRAAEQAASEAKTAATTAAAQTAIQVRSAVAADLQAAKNARVGAEQAEQNAVDISNIDVPDDVVELLIKPGAAGPKTKAALHGSFGSLEQLADLRNLAALDQLATHDQVKAAASLRTAWDVTAVGFSEPWADLAGWTAGDLQVVSGTLLSSAATSGKALRTLTGINTGSFRATVPLIVAPGGTPTSQTALFGITAGTTVGDAAGTNFLGVGLHFNGNLVAYDNNTPTALITKKGVTDPLPAGTYYITMSMTAVEISFTVNNAAGTLLGRYSKSRASWGKTANAVAFVIGDSRQATGNGFGTLVVRPDRLSGNPRAAHEDATYLTSRYSPPPTHTRAATFTVPAGYDSRNPLPVVIWCHGSSATEEDVLPGFFGGLGAVSKALLDAGFLVVASTFGGTTNWGNPNSLDAMTELYQHLRDRYPIGPIGLWGDSMGCQVALNTLARRTVPAVSFYGTRGAINLANAHATAAYTSAIRTAFGIAGDGSDYDSKTNGHDPLLRDGWEFRGVPMRFVASPDDTSIPKALNTDLFVDLVEPHTTEASVLTVSGDHTSNNHYNAADAVDFFKRTLRVAST